jgi:hypothetical protein
MQAPFRIVKRYGDRILPPFLREIKNKTVVDGAPRPPRNLPFYLLSIDNIAPLVVYI